MANDYTQTEGKEAFDILKVAGLDLLEWQSAVMDDWLAVSPTGKWVHKTCGLALPRQNGKTKVVVGRCAHGLIYREEEIIYTSHLQKTSTETFEELAALFTDGPLSKYVKTIKEAIGREQIIMKSGARIKFLARTRNGGRGQHGALLVFDEAQELDDNQQGSFLPAISASYNPQTIYTGTPPDENAAGTVFTRIRAQALSGETENASWAEWSVNEIGDITDRGRWAETNPSFGMLISAETIQGECEQMAPDRFARERLGWWKDYDAVHSVIQREAWDACATDHPATEGVTVFAVKFEPSGNVGTLCFCTKPEEGKPHVEFIESEPVSDGLQWLEDFLANVAPEAAQIVVDGAGYADDLLERLRRRGLNRKLLVKPRASDVVSACAKLLVAVNEGTITHLDEENINAAATKTARRNIGKDGWGFASTEEGDASIIEACALAYWQAMTTKRDPSRRGRIG